MTQVLRPTPPGGDKKKSEWVLQGEWGKRTYAPMERNELYALLQRELIADGVIPEEKVLYRFDVWSRISMCSRVDDRWVVDSDLVERIRNLPEPE